MSYPSVTQFETQERRARLAARRAAGRVPRRRALMPLVLRLRRRLAPQPC